MGRCLGPCWGSVTEEEYNKVVQEAIYFLQGKRKELQQMLKRDMEEAAESLDFERAAVLRDRYKAVSATLEKQHVVDPALREADILGVSRGEKDLELAVLSLRGGAVAGSRSFTFDPTIIHTDDFVSEFIKRYYDQSRFIPPEILLSETVTDRELSGRMAERTARRQGSHPGSPARSRSAIWSGWPGKTRKIFARSG